MIDHAKRRNAITLSRLPAAGSQYVPVAVPSFSMKLLSVSSGSPTRNPLVDVDECKRELDWDTYNVKQPVMNIAPTRQGSPLALMSLKGAFPGSNVIVPLSRSRSRREGTESNALFRKARVPPGAPWETGACPASSLL